MAISIPVPDDFTPKWGEVKLDPEFKVKWLAALRSGEHNQISERLAGIGSAPQPTEEDEVVQSFGYCCLGIACMVAGMTDDQIGGREMPFEVVDVDDPKYAVLAPLIPNDAFAPATVLAGKNDNGETFEEIANFIERHL